MGFLSMQSENLFDYKVIRSDRRSLSVIVKDGEVTVRAPRAISDEKIASFMQEQEAWVRRQLSRCVRISEEFKKVKEYKSILLFGKEKKLILGCEKNFETEDALCLKDVVSVKKYILKTRAFLLVEKTSVLSKMTGLCAEDVTVRDFKARWGCCGADKKIKLNWRLLFLPPDLQEYVIVHELCHLVHLDHSLAFWAKVGQFLPDYKMRSRRLKDYSFLTLLYR